MAGETPPEPEFGTAVGYVLVFNLIVGTGALALPKAFENAGYILAVILLVVSSFMSYVCATFVIEGMAIANAATQTSRLIGRRRSSITEHDISDAFKIKNRTEVSNMAQLFMGRYGVMILTLVMAVYLFGDLTIYTVTVPKSLMNVICSASINDSANASNTVNWDDPCWPSWPAWSNRAAIYRICVAGFVLLVTPLVVIGVSRTKYLQISTSVCRWTAFILMIILAVISLGVNGTPHKPDPVIAKGFGSLFGTTVYAFMCHHSLPSLITPMKSKKNVMLGVLIVYTCVFLFYVALSMTGAFAFTNILDVYSLNFLHTEYFQTVFYKICDYFLALFPVFTITSSYPIVGCTLLNNSLIFMDYVEELLAERNITFFASNNKVADVTEPTPKKMETIEEEEEKEIEEDVIEDTTEGTTTSEIDAEKSSVSSEELPYEETHEERVRRKTLEQEDIVRKVTLAEVPQAKPRLVRRYIVMCLLIGLCTLIAELTDNVLILAEVTGSYPGVMVQNVIPSLIAIFGRRYSLRELGVEVPSEAQSPFKHFFWPYLMLLWSLLTIIMVSLNFGKVFDNDH